MIVHHFLGDCGRLWVVVVAMGGCGWLWVIVGDCG